MYWCKTRQTYEHTMISITNSTTDYAHQSMFVSLKYIILSLFLVRSRWHHFEALNVWNTFLLVFRFMRDPHETRGAETCRRGEGCFRYFMQVTLGNTIQRRKPPSKRAWIQLTYGNIPLKMAKSTVPTPCHGVGTVASANLNGNRHHSGAYHWKWQKHLFQSMPVGQCVLLEWFGTDDSANLKGNRHHFGEWDTIVAQTEWK